MTEAMNRWRPIGLQYVRAWAAKPVNRDRYFIADKIIMDSRVARIEQPPDARCWGPVLQQAADEGIIRWVTDRGKAPHRKFSRTSVWIVDKR